MACEYQLDEFVLADDAIAIPAKIPPKTPAILSRLWWCGFGGVGGKGLGGR